MVPHDTTQHTMMSYRSQTVNVPGQKVKQHWYNKTKPHMLSAIGPIFSYQHVSNMLKHMQTSSKVLYEFTQSRKDVISLTILYTTPKHSRTAQFRQG